MLCLELTESDPISIGDNITIHWIRGRRGRVTIGIDAPREIEIVRRKAGKREPRTTLVEAKVL